MNRIVAQKKCTKCGETKSITEFHKNKKHRDGRCSTCKECDRKNLNEWRSKNPEKVRNQNKRQYQKNRDSIIKKVMDWAKKNPERHKFFVSRWGKNNREKCIESARKYRVRNPEKQLAKTRNYRAAHPEKMTEWNHNRRARKMSVGGSISAKDWREIKDKYGNKCLCCHRTNVSITMDHVVPLSEGGKHDKSNIQPLCGSCNSAKGTKTIDYRPC